MIRTLVDEFNAIPWNARGRKVGHAIQITVAGVGILFGPAIVTAFVNWLVP